MRALLDTNILIHREAGTVVRDDIGLVFRWLDRIRYEKCVHPVSLEEIRKHADAATVATLLAKLGSYVTLRTRSPDTAAITALRQRDQTENDSNDTSLLAEVVSKRVDLLITEDRGVHRKAAVLGISNLVETIDSFLEKANAEFPALADYSVLSVRREYFGNIDLADPFFDAFRADYPQFDDWFARKADESAYVCTGDHGDVIAFLYVKPEGHDEDYSDIEPPFGRAKRLKIGTFRVLMNGYRLGERFLKVVFDNAQRYMVDEIYVTLFRTSPEQERLIRLLEEWGFTFHGRKRTAAGVEEVYVRDFRPQVNLMDPRRTYPFVSGATRKFVVPIRPEHHTELLPDSILTTESPRDFVENRPNRNAIRKVYVSRAFERALTPGDVAVFYRTAAGGPAHYTSVMTTLGVVQEVITAIPDRRAFFELCSNRTVFSNTELATLWDQGGNSRPFILDFLYVQSFPPPRPTLKRLKEEHILSDAPRGIERLADTAFERLLEVARADKRLIVS
jgi:predicted nucleic acid-binding protein